MPLSGRFSLSGPAAWEPVPGAGPSQIRPNGRHGRAVRGVAEQRGSGQRSVTGRMFSCDTAGAPASRPRNEGGRSQPCSPATTPLEIQLPRRVTQACPHLGCQKK